MLDERQPDEKLESGIPPWHAVVGQNLTRAQITNISTNAPTLLVDGDGLAVGPHREWRVRRGGTERPPCAPSTGVSISSRHASGATRSWDCSGPTFGPTRSSSSVHFRGLISCAPGKNRANPSATLADVLLPASTWLGARSADAGFPFE